MSTSSPASDRTQRDRKPVPVCVYAGQSLTKKPNKSMARMNALIVRPGSHDLVAVLTQCRRRTHNRLELAWTTCLRSLHAWLIFNCDDVIERPALLVAYTAKWTVLHKIVALPSSSEKWPTVCVHVCVGMYMCVSDRIHFLIRLSHNECMQFDS